MLLKISQSPTLSKLSIGCYTLLHAFTEQLYAFDHAASPRMSANAVLSTTHKCLASGKKLQVNRTINPH